MNQREKAYKVHMRNVRRFRKELHAAEAEAVIPCKDALAAASQEFRAKVDASWEEYGRAVDKIKIGGTMSEGGKI